MSSTISSPVLQPYQSVRGPTSIQHEETTLQGHHPFMSQAANNTALRAPLDRSFSPSAYSYVSLKPATRKTVTTTTTTTTVHFAPIPIPRPLQASVISESERSRLPPKPWSLFTQPPKQGDALDPKLYPLARVSLPSNLSSFALKFGETLARFGEVEPVDPTISTSETVDGPLANSTIALQTPDLSLATSSSAPRRKGKSQARGDLSPRMSPRANREVASSVHRMLSSASAKVNPIYGQLSPKAGPSNARSVEGRSPGPPRKRVRTDTENNNLDVNWSSRSGGRSPIISSASGPIPLPSPQHSPGDTSYEPETTFAPASPLSSAPDADDPYQDLACFNNEQGGSLTALVSPDVSDLNVVDLGSGVELSTLISLRSLVESFSTLSPDLQSYVLFHLLRRSSVPVLQTINDVITPALKRDFIVDLPPELAVNILSFLDGQTLSRACAVSKAWRKLIDGEWRIWKQILISEDLWVGHGSEQRDVAAVQGRPFVDPKDLFLNRWSEGVWNLNYDEDEAARPTFEKIQNARRLSSRPTPADDEEFLSRFSPLTRFTDDFDDCDEMFETAYPTLPSPASDGGNAGITFNHGGAIPSSPHMVHPLKLVYRQRLLIRRNWAKEEPRHITFQGQGNNVVTCLQFDHDRIISASDARLIHVYDIRSGRQRATLDGHQGGVWALQYIGNVMVSGSTDRTVRVWDLATKNCTHTLLGHSSTVRCLQIVEPVNVNTNKLGPPIWEPPYPLIITGSRDWTLRIWKLPLPGRDPQYHANVGDNASEDPIDTQLNPYHLRLLTGHKHAVRSLAAHGRVLVSGSYDTTVRVWDSLTGECTHILKGHSAKVYAVVLDFRRSVCASGSMDGTVRMWSTETGDCIRELEGHQSLVGLLGLDRNHLVSAAADSTLRVWDARTGACRSVLAPHAGAITCFQHDENKVISGSDGTLKMWDVRTGALVRDLLVGVTGVWQVSFDQRFCIAAVQRNGQSEFSILDFGSVPFTNEPPSPSPSPEPSSEVSDVDFELRQYEGSDCNGVDSTDTTEARAHQFYAEGHPAELEGDEDDETVFDDANAYRSSPLARQSRLGNSHWPEVRDHEDEVDE